MKFFPGS